MLNSLSDSQQNMIAVQKGAIHDKLNEFELDWKCIKFETRLGSGSFGDCYKGVYQNVCVCENG